MEFKKPEINVKMVYMVTDDNTSFAPEVFEHDEAEAAAIAYANQYVEYYFATRERPPKSNAERDGVFNRARKRALEKINPYYLVRE